ncbi:MAG: hypothetical protein A2V83_04770 [Nitrospirae bacterium RBG_16_64_22]|nr:MAG: hypothetical protein A2V83_04770 [Nitrospirae bacterium RBG_16_64_22]
MAYLENTVQALRDYLLTRPDVLMAFVFGSFARGMETAESDFDVAVYIAPEGPDIEWEETRDYESENEIWRSVEKIVGRDTDLIVLNRAPSTLACSIVQEGIPVIVKDPALYLRFSLLVSTAAEDFREWSRDFRAIKQRSMSLTDVDRDRLMRIVDFLETELADHSKFAGIDERTYRTDADARRNVERWAENLVNASIDIAKIILASQKARMPQTYRETIEALALLPGFNPQTAETLARFAKLRNILAHEYVDIRFKRIRQFVSDAGPLYGELLDLARRFLG